MIFFLLASLSINAYLFRRLKIEQARNKEREPSVELDEFIADLLNGNGIVKLTRINPHDIFLRSPRARR